MFVKSILQCIVEIFHPTLVFVLSHQRTQILLISLFTLSTEPWDRGCRGLACTILDSRHLSLIIFAKSTFLNSLPLSLRKMCGDPNKEKISSRWLTTSSTDLFWRGWRTMNSMRWSFVIMLFQYRKQFVSPKVIPSFYVDSFK